MKRLILALATAAAMVFPAAARAATGSASIPFVNYGGIQNWTANSDDALYVESARGKWFKVDLAGPCLGLPFAARVGFDTGMMDTLDAFSSVIVDGERCPVTRITALSSAPGAQNKPKE